MHHLALGLPAVASFRLMDADSISLFINVYYVHIYMYIIYIYIFAAQRPTPTFQDQFFEDPSNQQIVREAK